MKKVFILLGLAIVIMFGLSFYKGKGTKGKYEELVLDFREDISKKQLQSLIKKIAKEYNVNPRLNSIYSIKDNVYVIKGDKELLEALRDSDVAEATEYIEPNFIYKATSFTPNDPMYKKQWNFKAINMEKAWEKTKGKGVVVAVIDTGIARVPDFEAGRFVDGYDFVNNKKDAADDHGHGTHVAGTVAQTTNNGLGAAGIAYEAKLMPLKVLDAYGGGTISDIAEAIRFAADNGADIINMSLGGGGESKLMIEAINYAAKKGVVIVAAAGNESSESSGYPARYDNVISVSALNPKGKLSPYSNYGAGVNISAPGGDTSASESDGIIQNTINSKGESIFPFYQGTSMASPHVAGVCALIKSMGVKEADQIIEILLASSQKINDDPLNHFGSGQLDAAKAVAMASGKKTTSLASYEKMSVSSYWLNLNNISLVTKLIMLVFAFGLGIFFKQRLAFQWNSNYAFGIFMGSSGLFFLKVFQHFDLPIWPFKLAGSSLVELGSSFSAQNILNPITASVLIPFVFVILFLGHQRWKWFAIGSSIGVTAALMIYAIFAPDLMWIGSGIGARTFLIINALVSFAIARLALRSALEAK